VDERQTVDACFGDGAGPDQLRLLQEAQEVQEAVRRKVKPIRWELFWRVVIEGDSIGEAATAYGLRYGTVFAAVNHVAGVLREEGKRRRPADDGGFSTPDKR
jgi:hypothetical protein